MVQGLGNRPGVDTRGRIGDDGNRDRAVTVEMRRSPSLVFRTLVRTKEERECNVFSDSL